MDSKTSLHVFAISYLFMNQANSYSYNVKHFYGKQNVGVC